MGENNSEGLKEVKLSDGERTIALKVTQEVEERLRSDAEYAMQEFQKHIAALSDSEEQSQPEDKSEPQKEDPGKTENNKNSEGIKKWSHEQVLLLIELIALQKERFLNSPVERKMVFKEVCEKMNVLGHSFSQRNVSRKWRNIVGTYKRVKEKEAVNGGNCSILWDYYDLVNYIMDTGDMQLPSSHSPKKGKAKSKKPTTWAKPQIVPKPLSSFVDKSPAQNVSSIFESLHKRSPSPIGAPPSPPPSDLFNDLEGCVNSAKTPVFKSPKKRKMDPTVNGNDLDWFMLKQPKLEEGLGHDNNNAALARAAVDAINNLTHVLGSKLDTIIQLMKKQ